eukprot:8918415-Pyramimonas_sp.AAC.1
MERAHERGTCARLPPSPHVNDHPNIYMSPYDSSVQQHQQLVCGAPRHSSRLHACDIVSHGGVVSCGGFTV